MFYTTTIHIYPTLNFLNLDPTYVDETYTQETWGYSTTETNESANEHDREQNLIYTIVIAFFMKLLWL